MGAVRPRDVADPVAAALAACAAMFGVALLGLWLLGAGTYGRLLPMAAALTGAAVGGTVGVTGGGVPGGVGGVAGGMPGGGAPAVAAGVTGRLDAFPLGVTLAGAAVLAVAFFLPLRRQALSGAVLAVRAGTVVLTATVVLALPARLGRGTITLPRHGGSPSGPGGAAGPGGFGQTPLGGLLDGGGLLGGSGAGAGAGRIRGPVALHYAVSLGPAVAGGLAWALVALALAMAVSRRAPVPAAWERPLAAARPYVSAVAAVVASVLVAGVVAALVTAVVRGEPKVAGAALVVAPNAVFAASAMGIGTPVTDGGRLTGGPLGTALGAMPRARGLPAPAGGLPGAGGRAWLPVAVAVLLLACGILAAVRARAARISQSPATRENPATPRHPAGAPDGPGKPGDPGGVRARVLRRAAGYGVRLALVLAPVMAAMALLSGFSLHVGISFFGTGIPIAERRLGADARWALLLGLGAGAAAGFAGGLVTTAAGGLRRTLADAGPGRPYPRTGKTDDVP